MEACQMPQSLRYIALHEENTVICSTQPQKLVQLSNIYGHRTNSMLCHTIRIAYVGNTAWFTV